MTLEQCKAIWKNRDESVKAEIIYSLEKQTLGPYSQKKYYDYWRKLIRVEIGLDCDPIDYLRAFSYKTFSDYWEAINGKKQPKKR